MFRTLKAKCRMGLIGWMCYPILLRHQEHSSRAMLINVQINQQFNFSDWKLLILEDSQRKFHIGIQSLQHQKAFSKSLRISRIFQRLCIFYFTERWFRHVFLFHCRINVLVQCTMYRVFFFTGPTPKSSKYKIILEYLDWSCPKSLST